MDNQNQAAVAAFMDRVSSLTSLGTPQLTIPNNVTLGSAAG